MRSIVRFLVRFFRVVDGGRAKNEIKQQRKREREGERGRQAVTSDEVKFNCVWLEIRELLSDPEYGSRNSLEKALENTRDGKREKERDPDSTFLLDPARSIFFPLSTVNLSWGDRLGRPASFLHVDLAREEIVSRSIYSIYSRDKRRGERW